MSTKVMIFKRFWHWSQAMLVLILLLSGFEIHGSHQLPGFENSVITGWKEV